MFGIDDIPGLDWRRDRAGGREAALKDITTRTFTVRIDSLNEEERSIEAVIASENIVRVFDPDSFRIIDEILVARGADLPNQVVLLDSHIRWATEFIRGSIRELHIEGTKIVARLFFASDERSEEDWQKVRDGHLTDISIGYRASAWVDIKAGTSETVQGKRYTAGERTLRISTAWRPREGSLTAIGADEAAKIREALDAGGRSAPSSQPRPESSPMNPQLRAYLESLGLRKEATDDEARAHLSGLNAEQQRHAQTFTNDPPGDPPADNPPPQRTEPASVPASAVVPPAADAARTPPGSSPPPVDPAPPAIADVVAQERQRVAAIATLAREHPDVPAELVTACCRGDCTPELASQRFLAAIRDARTPAVGTDRAPAGIVRIAADELPVRALIAGLKYRANLPVIDPKASDDVQQQQQREIEMGERFADCSMLDIVDHSLRFMGVAVPHGREARIRTALGASRLQEMRAVDPLYRREGGGSSTGSLVGIFTEIANAQLLMSFQETPDSTRGWVQESDVPDFKTNERTRLGKTSNFGKVARGDEAKHATIDDVKESYKLARYGKQFVVDEQDIIDDRFDALLRMPMEMGAAAGRLRPDLVYAIILGNPNLADGIALFHATSHGGNLITDVLADAGLRTGIQTMGKQTEGDARLNLLAAFLIVPIDLKHTALQLLRSIELRPGASTPAGQEGTFNPLSTENIEPRSDNRMGVAGVTDPATGSVFAGTATNWLLVCSPRQGPTIEVGYLRGRNRRPVMRSFVLDKGRWGIGWDVNHDIEAQAMAFHGVLKSTGGG